MLAVIRGAGDLRTSGFMLAEDVSGGFVESPGEAGASINMSVMDTPSSCVKQVGTGYLPGFMLSTAASGGWEMAGSGLLESIFCVRVVLVMVVVAVLQIGDDEKA